MSRPPLFPRRFLGRARRDPQWCQLGCRCARCSPAGPANPHARFRRWEVAIIILAALIGLLLSGTALMNVIGGLR